ncbi:MAG: hypothetical protein H6718_09025 [Polyangiaceae bacterium]|nr:hypothetical protein [Myxococcales bacterium]MCB9585528.1 hypothetical protein [Polyangiaceae bacterium]MCB9606456.1 hypothetical protein [Polyangiaceae bacterium]
MTQSVESCATGAPHPQNPDLDLRQEIPWHAYLLLVNPRKVLESLEKIADLGELTRVPNLWQIELGVISMWHRVLFRSDTVGTCKADAVRSNWRARALEWRPLRFPFLLREKAVAPLDFSGLVSSPERIISHLLGAHHDGAQFAYDLELLRLTPGGLERAFEATLTVTQVDSPRSRWLRDLVVYEGYHERLEEALRDALTDGISLPPEQANDPDVAFGAYLRWCAKQPATPQETYAAWRRGELHLWRTTGETV